MHTHTNACACATSHAKLGTTADLNLISYCQKFIKDENLECITLVDVSKEVEDFFKIKDRKVMP